MALGQIGPNKLDDIHRETKTDGECVKSYVHQLRSNVYIPPNRHVSYEQENTQKE